MTATALPRGLAPSTDGSAAIPAPIPLALAAYLVLGLAAMGRYFGMEGTQSHLGYVLVSLLPVLALVVGPLLYRVKRVWPWFLLAAGQLAFFVGDAIWYSQERPGVEHPFPSAADVPYLLAYPLMAAGLALFIRHRQPEQRLAPLVDAAAVAIAAALLLWIGSVETFIHDTSLPLTERLTLLAYPLGDAVLLGGAAYLLLAGGHLRWAQRVLVTSMALLLIADVLYSGMLVDVGYSRSWVDALWLGSYLLVGLSALMPSMRELTEAPRLTAFPRPDHHLFVLGAAFGAVPLFAVIQQLASGHIDVHVVVGCELLLGGLLFLRLHELTTSAARQDRRHAALLTEASDALTIVGADGSVRFASPASRRMLGLDDQPLVGSNVLELIGLVHPGDLPAATSALEEVMRGSGSAVTRDVRIRHADGRYRWLDITARNRIEDEAVRGIVLSYHDVTERYVAAEQLRFHAEVLANVRESVIVTDLEGRVTHWNSGATECFGYTAEEMLGGELTLIYPEPSDLVADDLAQILDGKDYNGEWRGRRKDGTTVWVGVRTSVLRDGEGNATGFIGVSTDITERRTSQALQARLTVAIEQSSDLVVITNAAGEIEYVNPAFEKVTGYSSGEVIGQNPRIVSSGLQPPSFYEAMWATLVAGRTWVADFTNRRKDGTLYQEESVISPIRSPSGENDGYVAVKRDVTEQRRLEVRAQEDARERALIGETLRSIDGRDTPEKLAEAICRQVASMTGVTAAGLFVFELDGTARPYGFVIGGQDGSPMWSIPQERSAHLRDRASRGPWIEAWVERPDHPYNDVVTKLGIRAVAFAPIRDGDTVIGFLNITSPSPQAEEVLSGALPALVDFAEIAGTLIASRVAERTAVDEVRQNIRAIIDACAFKPVFQPIVMLRDGRVVGYEALTRFDDGVRPDVHFAAAAGVGLTVDLELVTMGAALEAAKGLPPAAWLNLNVSPHLVVSGEGLAELVFGSERALVLEVTEHAAVVDYQEFRHAVHRLGPTVRLAIDDAGAGFASLRHILELRPAFVKLDRSLVAGIDRDEARQALVAGMVHFAQRTGCRLIAEGIETAEELSMLGQLEVDLGQGYLLGKPEPAAADRTTLAVPVGPRSRRAIPAEGLSPVPAVENPGGGA
jgi:PAS domain S-box-containing protein